MGGISYEYPGTSMTKAVRLAGEISSFLFEERYGECAKLSAATIKHLETARNSLLRAAKKH